MARTKKCSICGLDGHNARTCTQAPISPENEADHALCLKYDNITLKQADKLLTNAINSKTKIAPDGRVAFAKAPAKDLPKRIRETLAIESRGSGDEPKKIK